MDASVVEFNRGIDIGAITWGLLEAKGLGCTRSEAPKCTNGSATPVGSWVSMGSVGSMGGTDAAGGLGVDGSNSASHTRATNRRWRWVHSASTCSGEKQ